MLHSLSFSVVLLFRVHVCHIPNELGICNRNYSFSYSFLRTTWKQTMLRQIKISLLRQLWNLQGRYTWRHSSLRLAKPRQSRNVILIIHIWYIYQIHTPNRQNMYRICRFWWGVLLSDLFNWWMLQERTRFLFCVVCTVVVESWASIDIWVK